MALLHKDLSTKIYDGIFAVHRALGPGLLESAYEICLKKELEDMGFGLKPRNLYHWSIKVLSWMLGIEST